MVKTEIEKPNKFWVASKHYRYPSTFTIPASSWHIYIHTLPQYKLEFPEILTVEVGKKIK
jgi:hypothetical protein